MDRLRKATKCLGIAFSFVRRMASGAAFAQDGVGRPERRDTS
jgi:hypothetical protein